MVAYQTWIVVVLASASALIAALLDSSSGIVLSPVITIVLKVLAAVTIPLAANQLKTIGQTAPNTVTETKTVTTTPPAPPAVP